MGEKVASSGTGLYQKIEIVIWALSLAAAFNLYNVVGEVARLSGRDFTQYMITSWDYKIPTLHWTIIPYLAVYASPVCYLIGMV